MEDKLVDKGAKLNFKDKMKFFEQEIAQQKSSEPRPKTDRKFSYLNEHEVERMRKDEERKMSVTSQDELLQSMRDSGGGEKDFNQVMTSLAGTGNGSPVVKRVKSERLPSERLKRRSSEGCNFAYLRSQSSPGYDASPEKRIDPRKTIRMRSYDDSDSVKARVMRQRAASLQHTPQRLPDADKGATNGVLSPHVEHHASGAHNETDHKDVSRASDRDMGASWAMNSNMMSVSLHSGLRLSNGDGHTLSSGSLGSLATEKENDDINSRLTPHPSTEYKSLSVSTSTGESKVKECSRLVDDKISLELEEPIGEWTGEAVLKTIEFIEKTIEHEVETTKQQIMELQIQGHRNGIFRP